MALQDLVNVIPMCSSFTAEEKKNFASLNHSVQGFNEGDVIIKEGEKHSSLYLLINGTLLITKGGDNPTLAELEPGAIFGEMSYFTKKPRYTNVIASSKVMVIRMDDNFFKKITPEMKDKIKNHLLEVLINRLDSMNKALVKISKFAQGVTASVY